MAYIIHLYFIRMYIKWHMARLVLQVHAMTGREDGGIVYLIMQLFLNALDSILITHEQSPTRETLPGIADHISMRAYNLDKANSGPSAPGYAARFGALQGLLRPIGCTILGQFANSPGLAGLAWLAVSGLAYGLKW